MRVSIRLNADRNSQEDSDDVLKLKESFNLCRSFISDSTAPEDVIILRDQMPTSIHQKGAGKSELQILFHVARGEDIRRAVLEAAERILVERVVPKVRKAMIECATGRRGEEWKPLAKTLAKYLENLEECLLIIRKWKCLTNCENDLPLLDPDEEYLTVLSTAE